MAKWRTDGNTNEANALEKDLSLFENAWRCTPENRERHSFQELLKNIKELKTSLRIRDVPIDLLMVLTKLYSQYCIKGHQFTVGVGVICTWMPWMSVAFSLESPSFGPLVNECAKLKDALMTAELIRNIQEAFYCNSTSELFSEPTEGKPGLPAEFAVAMLKHYTEAMEQPTKDRMPLVCNFIVRGCGLCRELLWCGLVSSLN